MTKRGRRKSKNIHNVNEMIQSVGSFVDSVRGAFDAEFNTPEDFAYWVRDVLLDHPELGNVVIASDRGALYAVDYSVSEAGVITFVPVDEWQKVVNTYVLTDDAPPETEEPPDEEPTDEEPTDEEPTDEEPETEEPETPEDEDEEPEDEADEPVPAEAAFDETEIGNVIGLVENNAQTGALVMDVRIIRPGFGNERDNHYYGREMLKRDSGIFAGAKMYATEHVAAETNVRTWVSTILKVGERFDNSGAPVATVGVHDPAFAEKIKNLDELGILNKLHCSIRASGELGKKIENSGRAGRSVARLTKAHSVDWVSEAGAGGSALKIVENAAGQPEAETEKDGIDEVEIRESEKKLSQTEIKSLINESNLPDAMRPRLYAMEFDTAAELAETIKREVAVYKTITGAGLPRMRTGENETESTVTEAEVAERKAAVNKKYLK